VNNTKILDELRSPNATLVVLGLALSAQIPHAADVFRLLVFDSEQTCEWWCMSSYVHGYLFAVALEVAVLLFVVRNRQRESYSFAVVSVLMNVAYYTLHGIPLFSVRMLPALLVSVALPVAIALYSHVIADGEQARSQAVQRTRTTRVTRTDEQSEVYTEPVVSVPAIEQHDEQLLDVSALSIEQKRDAVLSVLRDDPDASKTELAERFEVARTTVYSWARKLDTVQP
jgi:hypothetical protein